MSAPTEKKLVAIAGGSSPGLGSTMLKYMAQSSKVTPIILSRAKEGTHPVGSTSKDASTGIETRYVNYTNVASLTESLKGIHTLVSVVLIYDPNAYLQTMLNMLHASRASGCKRFAPSEWALGPLGHEMVQPAFTAKIAWWKECQAVAAQARAQGDVFEVARFSNGGFVNYMGYGAPYETLRATGGRGEQDEAMEFFFREGKLEYPASNITGGAPRVTLTDIEDIGRYVAAAVELPDGEWEEEMGIAGDTLSFDEIVGIFEEVTGRKLEVTVLSKEDLEKRLKRAQKEDNFMDILNTQLMQVHAQDKLHFGIIDPVVNRKCPGITPMTVRQYIERFWGGRNVSGSA